MPSKTKRFPPIAKLTLTAQTGVAVTVATYGTTPGGLGTSRRSLTPVPIASWTVTWGDQTAAVGVGAPTATITHVYAQAGTYTPRLTVTDMDGKSATGVVKPALVVTAPPDVHVGDPIVFVGANDDLQAALDAATGGTTLILRAGATRVGQYVLPAHQTDGIVTVQTDGAIPAADTRITPKASPALPKFQSPDNQPALTTAPGAAGWHLIGLEVFPNADPNGTAVHIGDHTQTSLTAYPDRITLDRLLVRGHLTTGLLRGVALHARNAAVVNCHIDEIKSRDRDSQAIWINGPGPYRIANSFLEAAGETILVGGADLGILNGVPTDINIEDNLISKSLAWRAEGSPWQVKNLLELKNARAVRIRRNVFQNSWADEQAYAIVFTPRNQKGTNPWALVDGVIVEYNRIVNVASVFNLLGTDNEKPSGPLSNVLIRANLAVTNRDGLGGDGRFMQSGSAPTNVTVSQTTAICQGAFLYAYDNLTRGLASGWIWSNNLTSGGLAGVLPDPVGTVTGTAGLDACFRDYVCIGNVFADQAGPPNNFYPPLAEFQAQFVNYEGGNYHVINESTYAGKGADLALLP